MRLPEGAGLPPFHPSPHAYYFLVPPWAGLGRGSGEAQFVSDFRFIFFDVGVGGYWAQKAHFKHKTGKIMGKETDIGRLKCRYLKWEDKSP